MEIYLLNIVTSRQCLVFPFVGFSYYPTPSSLRGFFTNDVHLVVVGH